MNTARETPAFAAPENARDSHFHIFGDLKKYPINRTFATPPRSPQRKTTANSQVFGIRRMVTVQPSCFGTDNTCQLRRRRALRRRKPPRHRGRGRIGYRQGDGPAPQPGCPGHPHQRQPHTATYRRPSREPPSQNRGDMEFGRRIRLVP